MATLTVRNIDPAVARALKERAAAHGRSMEAEVRWILARATEQAAEPEATGLGTRIRARFAGLGWDGVERSDDAPRAAELP